MASTKRDGYLSVDVYNSFAGKAFEDLDILYMTPIWNRIVQQHGYINTNDPIDRIREATSRIILRKIR